MKQLLHLVLLFFCAAGVQAQEYQRVKNSEKLNGEQAYILPKAAILVEIQFITTTLTKGPLFDAQNYSEDQIKQYVVRYGVDSNKYETVSKQKEYVTHKLIEDSIKINVKGVPDYSKIFYVDPNKKWYRNQTVSFTYSSDGILSEGESSTENKSFDIVIKSLSGVASIAGSFFMGKSLAPEKTPVIYKIAALDEALVKFDNLGNQTNFDIYKDLKNRYQKAYEEVFSRYFYKEKKEVKAVKFLYIPPMQDPATGTGPAEVALFRFDKGKIFLNAALKNEITSKDLEFATATADSYILVFEKQFEQQLSHFNARTDDDTGFAYNIPLQVQLKLKKTDDKGETKIVYYEPAKIPQFGLVGYSSAKNKKLTFQLDPLTGELKKLIIEGKAVTTDQAGTVAPVVVDAVKLAKGESTATKLENEVKELENMKKKRDLIKELEVQ